MRSHMSGVRAIGVIASIVSCASCTVDDRSVGIDGLTPGGGGTADSGAGRDTREDPLGPDAASGAGGDPTTECEPGAPDCVSACTGCSIAGECVQSGAVSASTPCLVCDPAQNRSGWSNSADGECDDGNFCTIDDQCQSGVCSGAPRECDNGIACDGESTCDEEANACTLGDNQCLDATLCDATSGLCVSTCTGCLIDEICFQDGAEQTGNACQVCDMTRSITAFSPATGKACGTSSSECSALDTCDAAGVCQPNHVAAGERCGAQPLSCANPDQCNGSGTCQSRANLRVERCDGVDNDCDDSVDEGFVLSTDANNCGACNRSCGGSTCSDGLCAPIELASGQPSPTLVAVSNNDVYWTNQLQASIGGGVFRTPKDGSVDQPVLVDGADAPNALVLDATSVFWVAPAPANEVRAAALRGATRPPVADQGTPIRSLAQAGTFVYWSEDFPNSSSAFFRAPKAGGVVQTLGNVSRLVSFAAAQGNCGYFAGGGLAAPHITRACAGSSQLTYVGSTTIGPIAADDTGVYFIEGGVKRLPLDLSGTPTTLAPTAQRGLAIDAQFVYFVDGARGPSCGDNWSINRVPKSGGTATPIVLPPQPCPFSLAVDGQFVYWTNFESGQVMKAAK